MSEETRKKETLDRVIRAVDHLASDDSVVRSGMALGDAVIESLHSARSVTVSFEGLKGASSSYFNVFLRRIDEGCGIAELGDHIHVEFGSNIQKMIYERSLNAFNKGPRQPPGRPAALEPEPHARTSLWKRLLGIGEKPSL